MSQEMTCCVHFGEDANLKVTCLSRVSWDKILVCAQRWSVLNVPEKDISANVFRFNIDELSKLPVDGSIGYHRKCYSKFTDINRIAAAEKKKKPDDDTKPSDELESLNGTNSKRIMRSDCKLLKHDNNSSLLPAICLICKTEKYVVDRHTGKRKKERLAHCETNENLLIQAATAKNDEMMLL